MQTRVLNSLDAEDGEELPGVLDDQADEGNVAQLHHVLLYRFFSVLSVVHLTQTLLVCESGDKHSIVHSHTINGLKNLFWATHAIIFVR